MHNESMRLTMMLAHVAWATCKFAAVAHAAGRAAATQLMYAQHAWLGCTTAKYVLLLQQHFMQA
jgi:hypothetical protein